MGGLLAISNGTLTAGGAVLTAVGGLVTGLLAYLRNKKTDKLALYSQFVDDLHEEVDRLRTTYNTDRAAWDVERASMRARIDDLEARLRVFEAGGTPVTARRPVRVRAKPVEPDPVSVEDQTKSIIAEVMRQMGVPQSTPKKKP